MSLRPPQNLSGGVPWPPGVPLLPLILLDGGLWAAPCPPAPPQNVLGGVSWPPRVPQTPPTTLWGASPSQAILCAPDPHIPITGGLQAAPCPPDPHIPPHSPPNPWMCTPTPKFGGPRPGPQARVLAYLERLEAQGRESARKQEEEEQQEQKLAELKAKVQELRAWRDKLRAKLELQQKGLLEKDSFKMDAEHPSAWAVLEWKIQILRDLLQLFYLTGINGKLTRRGVCFCITTAFEGTYLQSYYLDVLTRPEVRIQCHSVPIFIPLEQIARKHLQTDMRRFLVVLFDHLNAYDGRRYQVDQLQEHFSGRLEGTLQRNSLCNLVVFRYNVSGDSGSFLFSAKLFYSDLCCSLPTEAIVSCMPNAPAELAEMAAAHSEMFRRLALHKAFASFSKAEETQDQAPINPPGSPQ
uniref:Centromere protein O n=1 Tax=Cairina moschata TaxID=8855 RepID=A0A8C3BGJ4_CAIMO